MALAIDTDALVMLWAMSCLDAARDTLKELGEVCERLPDAHHQARKAKWIRRDFPAVDPEALAQDVEILPVLPVPENVALQEALAQIPGIDRGEIFLLVAAAERAELVLLSGDARMLKALGQAQKVEVASVRETLRGRVLFLPQVIGALATTLGLPELERRWRATESQHKTLHVIFGSQSPTPEAHFRDGLSYALSELTSLLGPDYFYPLPLYPTPGTR